MSEKPEAIAVCLTADRQELTDRAVRCFQAQTYENKGLLVYDTGNVEYRLPADVRGVQVVHNDSPWVQPIGKLRNLALGLLGAARHGQNDPIIFHWDSDDWSAPTRMESQVKTLVDSGAKAVGYREMMFWKRCAQCHGFTDYCADVELCETCKGTAGEAWLFRSIMRNYIVGTSLCYWLETWKAKPFPECNKGEDTAWIRGMSTFGDQLPWLVQSVAVEAINENGVTYTRYEPGLLHPMMIAELHGANSQADVIDTRGENPDRSPQWVRTQHDDETVRKILEAA